MALYLGLCQIHGRVDVWASMQDGIEGNLSCPECLRKVERVYTAPYDHSENTWRPYYSEQLSPGRDPVYVKSRSDYYGLMKNSGLRPYESGMDKDKARKRAEEHEKSIDETWKKVTETL